MPDLRCNRVRGAAKVGQREVVLRENALREDKRGRGFRLCGAARRGQGQEFLDAVQYGLVDDDLL